MAWKKTYNVWDETSAADGLDGHLGWLCLLLAMDHGNIANVDLHEIVSTGTHTELSHCFDKGHALDITDCATELNNTDVRLFVCVIDGHFCYIFDPVLDCFDDVRDDLDCMAQIVTFAFLVYDVLVDSAGGNVIVTGQSDIQVAFVIAEIEIDFAAIVEDKDFTVSGA